MKKTKILKWVFERNFDKHLNTFIRPQTVTLFTDLHCVRYGQACIGRRYLVVHEDNEKRNAGDKRDADKIQADSEPAHGAAEEVVGGLVGVQKLLISAGTER